MREARLMDDNSVLQGSGTRERWLREFLLDCLGLLWPTVCVGCGRHDRDLCVPCARELCNGKVERLDPGGLGAPCFVTGSYSGVTRAALIAYKHRGVFGLSRPLGKRLAAPLELACGAASRDPPAIVTVPSRTKRVRERGYQHLDVLVKVALRSLPQGVSARLMPVLRPLRGRTGQVGLDIQARQENAKRVAVRKLWAPDLAGREVILVDDIVTTGATVRAATEVLEAAGARVIAVVALCAAVRKDTPKIGGGNRT